MTHPVLSAGHVAAVTGAASGIGLATCRRLADIGLKVCMSDITADALAAAAAEVSGIAAGGSDDVLSAIVDVGSLDELSAFNNEARARFGGVDLLMNNAVTRIDGGTWEKPEAWRQTFEVNFMGVVNGAIAFLPDMLARGEPGLIVNVGSKQGITNPPGPRPAYNAAKAAVINYTENLQHELRNIEGCRLSAHLLVPGWTTTGDRHHQQGAWLPDQVVDFMIAALEGGDFYIVCPDDDVSTEEDHRRILWAAGDIIENRPPLSRWHPEYAVAYRAFRGD